MRSDNEIKAAVQEMMRYMANEVEQLSYYEAYDFTDEEVDRAMELQLASSVTITWKES